MLLVPLIILIFDVFAIQSVIIISCSGVLSQELFVCVCDVSTFDAVTAFNIFLILMLSPLFLVFLLFLVLLFTLFVFFLLSVCCRNIALSVVTDVLPVLYFFCRSFWFSIEIFHRVLLSLVLKGVQISFCMLSFNVFSVPSKNSFLASDGPTQ